MKSAVKIVVIVLVVIGLLGGGFLLMDKIYKSGDKYYVKITDTPEITEDQAGPARTYKLTGYDKNGNSKDVEFWSKNEKKLRIGAYLCVTVKNNRTMSYEEVEEKDVPQKAMDGLSK